MFNITYDRTGTLWEGRYKAALIDSEQYLLTCNRYIELNSVRAKMVDHPSKYPWSSYGFNALGKENTLVTSHLLYRRLGRSFDEQQQAYRQLFQTRIAEMTLEAIREATNKAWVLGSERFRNKIEKLTARKGRQCLFFSLMNEKIQVKFDDIGVVKLQNIIGIDCMAVGDSGSDTKLMM